MQQEGQKVCLRLLKTLTNHISALALMELTKHCWEQHGHSSDQKKKTLASLSERQQIHTTTVRSGLFSPLCISSDPPPNDKVLTDFKRTRQDWAEKELKKEMPSESLVGGEKKCIVSSLYSFKINSATNWRNPLTLVKMEQ